jgi:hypothetical protein
VRLPAEAVLGPVRQLAVDGPAPAERRPTRRPETVEDRAAVRRGIDRLAVSARAAPTPVMPFHVAESRRVAAERHAEILALMPNVGDVRTWEELAGTLRWPREALRSYLDVLVGLGDLVVVKRASAEPERWRRNDRPRFGAPVRGGGTKIVGPKASKVQMKPATPKRRRGSTATLPPVPPIPWRSCRTCNSAARTTAPACPGCGTPYRDAP